MPAAPGAAAARPGAPLGSMESGASLSAKAGGAGGGNESPGGAAAAAAAAAAAGGGVVTPTPEEALRALQEKYTMWQQRLDALVGQVGRLGSFPTCPGGCVPGMARSPHRHGVLGVSHSH